MQALPASLGELSTGNLSERTMPAKKKRDISVDENKELIGYSK